MQEKEGQKYIATKDWSQWVRKGEEYVFIAAWFRRTKSVPSSNEPHHSNYLISIPMEILREVHPEILEEI